MANQVTSNQYLFQLNLIYGAQAFFMVVFGLIAFVMNQSTHNSDDSYNSLLLYTLVAVTIGSMMSAHFVFNLLVQRIDQNLSLKIKLQKYLSTVLIRSALLEFPGLFASVVSILTGSLYPLIGVLLILIVFFLLRPSTSQIIIDLSLSPKEKEMLEDRNGILV